MWTLYRFQISVSLRVTGARARLFVYVLSVAAFQAIAAEFGSCNRDCMARKA